MCDIAAHLVDRVLPPDVPYRQWVLSLPIPVRFLLLRHRELVGKLLAVFQQAPDDPNKTVVTVFMALAIESSVLDKRKEFAMVPVLRNLVPAQVLAGKSSFNTGHSLSAGLPVYARSSVKAIAVLLQNG